MCWYAFGMAGAWLTVHFLTKQCAYIGMHLSCLRLGVLGGVLGVLGGV